MMVEIMQLRANTKHHTSEFTTLRGAIAYVQRRIASIGMTMILMRPSMEMMLRLIRC